MDDEMVRVIMRMNSDPINYGCTPSYVTATPKVPIELPLMPSIQTSAFEHYSSFHSHNDPIDDNVVNTDVDNMHAETYIIESEMNFGHCHISILSPSTILEERNVTSRCQS